MLRYARLIVTWPSWLPDFQGIAAKLGYLVGQDLLVHRGKRPRHKRSRQLVGNLATMRAEPLGPAGPRGGLFGLTHKRLKVYH